MGVQCLAQALRLKTFLSPGPSIKDKKGARDENGLEVGFFSSERSQKETSYSSSKLALQSKLTQRNWKRKPACIIKQFFFFQNSSANYNDNKITAIVADMRLQISQSLFHQ